MESPRLQMSLNRPHVEDGHDVCRMILIVPLSDHGMPPLMTSQAHSDCSIDGYSNRSTVSILLRMPYSHGTLDVPL
jgi:hypothetical protein